MELYPSSGEGPLERGGIADVRLGLGIAGLDELLAELGASLVVNEPVERDGARVAVVADPDGRRVELTET